MAETESRDSDHASAGFTLVEVLVALAVVAISLSAIERLMAANTLGVRKLHDHLALTPVARAVQSMVPDEARGRSASGQLDGYDWRIDFRPFFAANVLRDSAWTPQIATITVSDPKGGALKLETVRLTRKRGR